MRGRVGGGGETGLSGFLPTRGGRVDWEVFAILCAEIEQLLWEVLPHALG